MKIYSLDDLLLKLRISILEVSRHDAYSRDRVQYITSLMEIIKSPYGNTTKGRWVFLRLLNTHHALMMLHESRDGDESKWELTFHSKDEIIGSKQVSNLIYASISCIMNTANLSIVSIDYSDDDWAYTSVHVDSLANVSILFKPLQVTTKTTLANVLSFIVVDEVKMNNDIENIILTAVPDVKEEEQPDESGIPVDVLIDTKAKLEQLADDKVYRGTWDTDRITAEHVGYAVSSYESDNDNVSDSTIDELADESSASLNRLVDDTMNNTVRESITKSEETWDRYTELEFVEKFVIPNRGKAYTLPDQIAKIMLAKTSSNKDYKDNRHDFTMYRVKDITGDSEMNGVVIHMHHNPDSTESNLKMIAHTPDFTDEQNDALYDYMAAGNISVITGHTSNSNTYVVAKSVLEEAIGDIYLDCFVDSKELKFKIKKG